MRKSLLLQHIPSNQNWGREWFLLAVLKQRPIRIVPAASFGCKESVAATKVASYERALLHIHTGRKE